MVPFQDLIIPFCTALLFFLLFTFHQRRSSKNLPPSPMKLPIIGNLHQVGSLPHRSLQSLSNRYGPLMLLHFGSFPVLIVSSADAAREIMKNQDLNFSNRPCLGMAKKLFYGCRDVAFSSYGEHWRQMRSICVLHLLSNKKVQSFHRIREEEASNMIDRIKELGCSTINLSEMIYTATNEVITRVALGRKYGKDDEQGSKLKEVIAEVANMFQIVNVEDVIPWLGWINRINGLNAKAENVAQRADELLGDLIAENREKKNDSGEDEASSFIDILLRFQRENGGESPVEDEAIKAIILDMFIAGTDTTAIAIEWAMSELLKNPSTLRSLQNEVRSIINSKDKKVITDEDFDRMSYLRAVLKETLRLHPPAPLLLPRESAQQTRVHGYEISAGTRVMINAWAIANDPNIWEDPRRFKPERFLTEATDFRGLHFEFIPFGSGRRGCPGTGFAVAMAELVIAKLVYHFDFSLPDGKTENDLDMSEASGVSVHKRIPLLVVASCC